MANNAIYGIVSNRTNLEKIVHDLKANGIATSDISFLSQNETAFPEYSSTNTTSTTRNWRTEERVTDYSLPPETKAKATKDTTKTPGGLGTEKHTKAPEGATAGGLTGGVIGGVLGLLAGIGALAIPGFGPFIAAGPILAALSGIGAGGTIGGIIGGLVGAGIPEYEAKRYENKLKEGGILIAVRSHSDAETKKIKDILQKDGAQDITSSTEAHVSKNYDKK
ncbi:MAG: DUF3341 domain-containing protein [Parachlamydiaceae bacterium]|nr:DUF3341 domain-containing protein [Parachlamydiaceae bacterium]